MKRGFVFKSGRAAFLRRAIEDGFGPPKGYEEARRGEAQITSEKDRRSAEVALSASKQNSLRATLNRLEIDQPDVFSAFMAYVEKKTLDAIDKPILKGAPEVRERLLQSFQSEGTRLALLADYLRLQPL